MPKPEMKDPLNIFRYTLCDDRKSESTYDRACSPRQYRAGNFWWSVMLNRQLVSPECFNDGGCLSSSKPR